MISERLLAHKSDRRTLPKRVRDELARELRSGVQLPGDRLADEDEPAGRFGAIRGTIREAIGVLVGVGYLVRRHGPASCVLVDGRARLARLLAVRVGSPIQQIEQVGFDELCRPVMLSSEYTWPTSSSSV